MAKVFPKFPKMNGVEKAIKVVKKIRRQQPSDRLVQIISEYGHEGNLKKTDITIKTPVAAKDMEA